MKKWLAFLLLFISPYALATGFTQSTFTDSPSITYPNPFSSTINITYQLPNTGSTQTENLYLKSGAVASTQDPNQLMQLYTDSALTQSLYGQTINLQSSADGNVHTITLYAKYYSSSTNYISKVGIYNFSIPIYIMSGTTEYDATINGNASVSGACGFIQPSFSTSFNMLYGPSSSPVEVANVGYNCSPGYNPSLTAVNQSISVNGYGIINVNVYQDSGASIPFTTAKTLNATGTNQSVPIYFIFSGSNGSIPNGTYTANIPLTITY